MSIKVKKKPSREENVMDDIDSPRCFVCRLKFEYFANFLFNQQSKNAIPLSMNFDDRKSQLASD